MRTTLDIDDDALEVAKSIARVEGRSLGVVVSDLVRRAVTARSLPAGSGFSDEEAADEAYGWHVLPSREGVIVTRQAIVRVQQELDMEDAGLSPPAKAARPSK
jgi:hypothetical protein